MAKPKLVIMAAGLGSRYGGLKQISPVDDEGHLIIDFSIYDAVRAGFESVVCIVKPELERDFREAIGDRLAPFVKVEYAFQTLHMLPEGFSLPEGREKPWGTGHAVLCAKEFIDGPFSAINADDFYGRTAFRAIYDFLVAPGDEREHAMVGYRLENTLTENGYVSRGCCKVGADGYLSEIIERVRIEPREGGDRGGGDSARLVAPPVLHQESGEPQRSSLVGLVAPVERGGPLDRAPTVSGRRRRLDESLQEEPPPHVHAFSQGFDIRVPADQFVPVEQRAADLTHRKLG